MVQLLQAEIDLVEALNTLIHEEREALIEKNFELITCIADKKEALAEQLHTQTQKRLQLVCQGENADTYQSALPGYLTQLDDKTRDLIHHLNTLLSEKLITCKTGNAVNGQVITANIQMREHLLEAVGASHRLGATYGEQGQVDRLRDASHHHEA